MTAGSHTPSELVPFDPAARDLGVVVGFDGSEHSVRALRYAARAARRRDTVLTVVCAFTVPVPLYTTLNSLPEAPEEELKLQIAEQVLDQARDDLKDYPGDVAFRAERGDASGVLVGLSAAAQLIVVGARGRGGFLGRVLGSVASALPAHALCPTVVVPHGYPAESADGVDPYAPTQTDTPVVVGVDGSSPSRVAALQAAHAAAGRGVALHMVMSVPSVEGALMWYPELIPTEEDVVEQRRRSLEEQLAVEVSWLQGHYPDLIITPAVEIGDPITVLVQATESAQLTVVGTRGRGAVKSWLMGSVSRGVLLHADGAVLVVPWLTEPRLNNQPHFTR